MLFDLLAEGASRIAHKDGFARTAWMLIRRLLASAELL